MATKENNTGLLSKVAKFVRNPTTNWTDLDKQDPEPATGYSKQALKEMIERKRQNDFVRKREFDQLRKLRTLDPSGGNPDLAGRPSYFQSSLPSNSDERAMTIKKIDEIEAQMSNQWWQGKNDGVRAPSSAPAAAVSDAGAAAKIAETDPAIAARPIDNAYAPTRLSPMVSHAALTGNEVSDFPPTENNSSFGKIIASGPTPLSSGPVATSAATARSRETSGFSHSESFAAAFANGATDVDLEEAAIRFANGDDAGAESGLLAALEDRSVRRDLSLIWNLALFDLYRATGQQSKFDLAALEFAERFGRSAPAWFSIPDLLCVKNADDKIRTTPAKLSVDPLWQSPVHFSAATVNQLLLAVANANSPWYLDWSAIDSVAPEAVEPLGRLFDEWCSTDVQLRFAGSAALDRVLRACAPSGDKTVDQANWRLRLDALRVMRQQDEFELVALDFCVTFEVSPPPWQEARCGYADETGASPESAQADAPVAADGAREVARLAAEDMAATIPMGLDGAPAATVEMAGNIVGEAKDALTRLEDGRQGLDRMVVSCANLIRVDFSAAGSILNWVALRQAEGCQLQFRDMHRLAAAFFYVIGISEHARVVVRSD